MFTKCQNCGGFNDTTKEDCGGLTIDVDTGQTPNKSLLSVYLGMLMGKRAKAAAENAGLDIELRDLTTAGWLLVLSTATIAGVTLFTVSYLITSNRSQVGRRSGVVFGIAAALTVGSGVFWGGNRVFEMLGIKTLRDMS